MDIDLILASAHHLAVFTIIGIIAAEFALLRPGIGGPRLMQLARIDGAYGIAATLVIAVGIGRVYFGIKGPDYYLGNHVFWTKMALFIAVGLLSIQPTVSLLRWSKALKADAAFVPADKDIAASRRFIHFQIIGLALIPIAAAAMARGYGS